MNNRNFHPSGLRQPNKHGRRHLTIPAGTAKIYTLRLRANHRDTFGHRIEVFMGATNQMWPQRDPRTDGPCYYYPRLNGTCIARN